MTLLAKLKARAPELRKEAVAVCGFVAVAVSSGALSGTALRVAVDVLAAAAALGVYVTPDKPSADDAKTATARAIAEAIAAHDGPITATVLTSPTPPPTPGA